MLFDLKDSTFSISTKSSRMSLEVKSSMARKKIRAVNLTPSPFKVASLLTQLILLYTGLLAIWVTKLFILGLWLVFLKVIKFSHRKKSVLKTAIALIFIIDFILFCLFFISTIIYQLPSPKLLAVNSKPLTTQIFDRQGKLLYRLYEGQNRTLVKLEELPPYLIWAAIAAEDKNFYKHPGFDILALARALYNNIFYKHQEGASTITQQLIKNTLLTPEKTINRKIKEIILAVWTEKMYSKSQILEMYFNEVPYGGPAWGVEAAARVYFNKSAHDLNLSEAAFLAGLPASPSQFSPYGTQPELAKLRQVQVLEKMAQQNYITDVQKHEAISQTLDLKPPTNQILAPHFVFYVKDLLSQKYGSKVVSQGGLKIYTSLDLDLQQKIEEILSSEINSLAPLNVTNGAALVTDPKTGQILAMVGSRDYHYPIFGNFNATLGLRQPGSSIKVVTYVTAFKAGFSPGITILDAPTSFKDTAGKLYQPLNYDGRFRGPVSIRQALGSSLNLPAVKLLYAVSINSMIATAKDLGITTFDDLSRFGLSLTLGGGEVKMIEMMGVYGVLADSGKLNPPTPILKVLDSKGEVLEEYKEAAKQVISPQISYLMTNILSDNNARILAFGPNSLLNIDPSVAVKTGTSDNKRDNWTFGYTADFVVGVWVGNNDNSPMNPQLTSGITGAAPIWQKITKLLLAQHPAKPFLKPEGLVDTLIDGRHDLAISGVTPQNLVRVKHDGNKLIFQDDLSIFATSSAQAAIKEGVTN